MKRLLPIAALLLALASAFLLRGRPAAEPAPVVWKADLSGTLPNSLSELPGLDHAVDSFLNFWGIRGASLAISRNDSLLYARGYGQADDTTPMTPDVRLRLASVSKLLTAVGVMRLQEQGKVFLETPVFGPLGILKEYDPYIRDEACFGITVEHLMRHQAGFTARGGDVMFRTLEFMRKWGLKEPPTADYLVKKELGKRLAFEPGTWQEYSNFGYLLLSLVIEKVSGLPYEEFMQKEVFEPALCRHFAIGGNYLKERLPGESRYYMQADAEDVPSFDGRYGAVEKCYGGNHISGLMGAGAWVGTAPELTRLVAAIDGFGTVPDLLNGESIGQMTAYFDPDSFGLGWVDCKPDGELTRTGSFSGTTALVKVYPDGECWVVLCNTSAWRGSRFTKNIAALVKNLRGRFSGELPERDLFRE